MKKILSLVILAGSAMFLAACSVPAYNITVYMSPKFVDVMKVYPSLELDVVGVNPNEAERLKGASVEEYFEYNGALRRSSDKCTLTFSEDSIAPKLLPTSHSIWKVFAGKEADQLFLIVNVPEFGKKATGNAAANDNGAKDARKLFIPLENPGMFGDANRYFEITPTGLIQLKEEPDEEFPDPEDITSEGKKK